MKTHRVHLSEDEVKLINSTPPSECWICEYLQSKIRKDRHGIKFIDARDLTDEDVAEHLLQLLRGMRTGRNPLSQERKVNL